MKQGILFGESIKTENIKKRSHSEISQFNPRGFLLISFLFATSILFTGRLIYLQVFRGAYYRNLSDSNRIRTQVIYAQRGIIFDRNGVPLVLNVPGFRQIINGSGKDKKSKEILLNKDQALLTLSKGEKNITVDSLREYPYKDIFAHVLGYVGQISESELKNIKASTYAVNDRIGKTGIEKQYESVLRGIDGKELFEVDAMGAKMRSLGQTDPTPGQDITLTLDVALQKAAYQAAKDIQKGAVIVTKPNGEILAMISKPVFDPNLFTLDTTYTVSSDNPYKTISSILSDSEGEPLLDRATSGVYPPGSTFKLIIAASGLENKIIDEGYTVTDTGVLNVGSFSFANWFYTDYGKIESGKLNIVRALARSNDIFFYKLAEKIKEDRISAMATKFGLGNTLGIDLPGEAKGLVPTSTWKEATFNEKWFLGDTYHYGIGQGYLLTTPLQVNSWTQVIANGGILYQPTLLKDQRSLQSGGQAKIKDQRFLSEKTVSLIREGMIESCSPGGVAWPLFEMRVENGKLKVDEKNFMKVASESADTRQVIIACKTGTAEHGGKKTLPHAWITLFAPAFNPEIVVTVLNESSGEGSNKAAPVAKEILEAYFRSSN